MKQQNITNIKIRKYFRGLQAHPQYTKTLEWGKVISFTGITELGVKAIGFFSGILIIRLLPVEEYALYTLANTMLGTMTVLADGGISAGVMAEGGKVWQDKKKLGLVLATGLDLRRKFAVGSLLISIPVLVYLLIHHNASWLMSILISASLVPTFYAALSDSLLQIVPKLHQDVAPLQKNQMVVEAGRLALTAAFVFIFPFTFIALLANGFPRIYGNVKLRDIAHKFADTTSQDLDAETRREILLVVKRVLPVSIYYCISGQITIWLISIFGTSTSLGQLGALGRFVVVFSSCSALFSVVLIPRFARLTTNINFLKTKFFQYQAVLIVLSSIIVITVAFISEDLLRLLGSEYSGLHKELVLITLGGAIAFIGGSTNEMLSSRGIVLPPITFIITTIIVQAGLLFFLKVSELTGVILYGLIVTLATYLLRIIYFMFYIKRQTG